MKKFKVLFSILIINAVHYAQNCPTYTVISAALQGTTQLTTGNNINFPVTSKPQTSNLREKNKSANIYFTLDLGNDYIKQNTASWKFKAVVDVSYQFAGSSQISVKTLTITDSEPEMLKSENVLTYFTNNSPAFSSTVNIVSITNGTTALTGTGLLQNYLFNNIRLSVKLEREYAVDVRYAANQLMSAPLVIAPVAINNRLVSFSWQPSGTAGYPNYELQVLKLNNRNPGLTNTSMQINTEVNWENALSLQTQSCRNSIDLTISEGSGYYLWRVRPIGNYYPGSIANSENYGEWSNCYLQSAGTVSLTKSVLTPTSVSQACAFYFTDPDENINWIYNRVFTEGDTYNPANPTGVKATEGISYADGLLRTRQSQKYNSSENTNLVSQSIHDYAGRAALNTIPVPTPGALNGYKSAIVQNTMNTAYTASDFDNDLNIYNPSSVNDVNTPFRYYSGNATTGIDNSHVPNAEGYPFKRTIYKNDGTNRVEEESGVGKTHAIGSQTNGMGRTTKVFYSTPSDDELIRIFGEEAPLSQSVIKTTTIDQNNVVSISYTSKEGKTIATALSSASVSNLASLGTTVSAFTVFNEINQNVISQGKAMASKRVAISTNSTVVNLSYFPASIPGLNVGCITADCNYKLRFYLVDIKNNITYVSDADASSTQIDNFSTTANVALNFPSSWAFIDIKGISPALTPVNGFPNQLVLNAGEYIFMKELYSGNGPNEAELLVSADNDKTRPILEAISREMKLVNSAAAQISFNAWLAGLKTLVDQYNLPYTSVTTNSILSYLKINPTDLEANYVFPKLADFSLSAIGTNTSQPASTNFQITTKCCGNIDVQMPGTKLCFVCDGSPLNTGTLSISGMTSANDNAGADDITPYGMNDFKNNSSWAGLSDANKRQAIKSLVDREFIIPFINKLNEENINPATELWKFAPGFSYESLNFMISNMLISKYYTGSAIKHNGVWYEATKNSLGSYNLGGVITATNPAYPYNYDCEKLYNAWQVAIEPIGSFDVETDDNNVIKKYDSTQGPLAALGEMLNFDNWNPSLKMAVQCGINAITNVVNKFSNSHEAGAGKDKIEAITSVPATFVRLAGKQFAAIIDGSNLPTHISSSGAYYPDDYLASATSITSTPSGPASIYTTITTGVGTSSLINTYVPQLFTVNNSVVETSTTTCNSNTFTELYYPYVLKPEWMFKYFVYNVYENQQTSGTVNFIDDNSFILPNQVLMDLNWKYKAPFSYLTSSVIANNTLTSSQLCNQPVLSTYSFNSVAYNQGYFHDNWSSAERLNFYENICGGGACFTNKGLSYGTSYYVTVNGNNMPVCPDKYTLFANANAILTEKINNCDGMATDIKSSLLNELELACYTIVACKSTPTVAGEISIGEVDLMVAAVISKAKAEIQAIKNNFSATAPASVIACTASSLLTQAYSATTSCDLPACAQTDCKEIVLYEDNTLGLHDNRLTDIRYFNDCDLKILYMIETGTFLPDIPPAYPSCNKATKVWRNCSTTYSCGNKYEEKSGCTNSSFEKYSKTYTITATGN